MKKITGIGLKISSLHRKFLILFVIGVLLPLFNVNAQSGTIQIGSGTETGTGEATIPVTNYHYSYSQQIVSGSEYALAGGGIGPITKIRYYTTSIGTMTVWNNWTVYLGNTTKNSFSSTADWIPISELTQVFTGTITATASNWFEITFSQPFNYTGGNIVVAVDENAFGWLSAPTFRTYTVAGSNKGLLYRDDTTNPDPVSPPTATSRQSKLPQLQFEGQLATCLPPTNATASLVTANSATIAWTASISLPSGGYVYEVRTDTNPGTTGAVDSGVTSAGVLNTQVSGLTSGTGYNIYLRSNCGTTDGFSGWVGPYTFTTACSLPDASTNLTFTNVSATATTTNYVAPTVTPTGYVVFRSTSNVPPVLSNGATYAVNQTTAVASLTSGTNTYFCVASPTTLTGTATNLTSNTQYYYYVFSRNSQNSCSGAPWYSATSLTGGQITAPAPPTLPVASDITISSATLSWTASVIGGGAAPISYVLEVYTNSDNTGSIAGSPFTIETGVTQVLSGLSSSTPYYYRIKATNTFGESTYLTGSFVTLCTATDVTYVMPIAATTGSSLPICVTVENLNNDNRTWVSNSAQSGIIGRVMSYSYHGTNAANDWFYTQGLNLTAGTSYRLRFKAKIASATYPEKLKVAFGTSATHTAMVTPLYSETINSTTVVSQVIDFIPTVTGVHNVGFQAFSDADMSTLYVGEISVELTPSCFVPQNLQVTSTSITKNSATISWSAPEIAPANGYEYEIRTSGDAGSGATGLVQQGVTVAGVLSKDITGLTPSTTYSLYVRSVCAADNLSAWTIVKTFKTLCDYPDFISKTVGTICGIGTASISANFTNNNNIKWYAEQTGGNSLHTGTSFTTPELNTSTSFWVSASSDGLTEGAGAKPAPASSATGSSFSNWGIVFNVSQDIVLKSTDVYSSSNGTLDVKILNPAGTEIFSTGNVNVINGGTTTANVIPLNVTLSAGVGYKILIKNYSGVNLIRESSGLAFPYIEANGTLTATASEWGGTTTGSYYYFYNLKYEVSCSSPRIEVPVTVTEAPGLILSADEITICQGNDSELITVMSGLADYDTFTWTPETGVSGNEIDGWLINAQSSGMYTLRASQSNGSLCKADVELNVLVTQIGYEPLEEEYIVCKDVIQELSVGADEIDINDLSGLQLYNFSFDQVPLQGFTHNNLTGTTSVALNTSVFTEGTGSVRFSHVTSSTGNLTQNSSVDASGGYGVKVEFDHIGLLESSSYDWDYGYLQYSLDGGNTWVSFGQSQYLGEADTSTTTPINYVRFGKNSYTDWNALTSTSTPVNSLWKHETFFLQKGDLDLSNFKIRFSLKSDGSTNWNGWYLDNLKISKVSLPTTVWTGQGLFVDADATQAYAGENTQTVYFKHNLEGEYPVSATISNAVTNCSATTTTIVKVPLVILPVLENQVYCEPKGVEDLIFDRTDGYVYAWYASATSVATISTINTSGTYYLQVTSNVGECKSSRVPVEIIIAQNLNPTVNPSYTFCDQATFENIQVGTQYGAAVQWFATADSTTVLPANTQLSTTTYYVALAINDCISERKPVSVTILQTPAPIATQEFTVCFNTPLSQLSLGATNIKWYYSQTSSTALGVSAIAQSNTYYVTTFNGICESARIPVIVTVVQQLQMPTAATQNFCGSGTVSQLTATGAVSGAEYVWYNSATSTTPLQPGAALQNGTYYVSQKLTNCESPRRPVTVKVTNLTAPTATSFEFCGSATVADLSMPVISGITYNWYLPNQTTPLAATANLVTGNYLVSKAQNGCESTKTIVQVTIKPRPVSPTGSLAQNFIDSAMISDLVMDQSNVIWYVTYEDALNGNNPLQTNMPLEDGHIYYGVLIGSNGCASLPTAVTVTITLGVKDLDLASLKYYPNPVDSELTITYKEQIKLIEIYDLLGKQIKVQKFDSNDIRVNVSGLSSGTYMLRVQTNTGSQFIKIIKK